MGLSDERTTQELYDTAAALFIESLRVAITIAAVITEEIVRAREESLRREQAASEERARAIEERMRAERSAVEPVLREVWQERFWRTPDAQKIGRAWQAASEWAGGDTYAQATLDHLREELKTRFGIEAPQWAVGGAEVSRLVALSDPTFQQFLSTGRDAAGAMGNVAYVVLIRDLNDPFTIVFQGQGNALPGMNPAVFAARQFAEWAAGPGAAILGNRDVTDFVIEVAENTGDPAAGQVPAAQVRGGDVQQVLAADEAWQRAVIAGTQAATTPELMYALGQEVIRQTEEENRRLDRLDETRHRLTDPGLSDADRQRLENIVSAINTGLPQLRREMAATRLRREATAAQIRGEDPAHVYAAATLRELLDDEWWQTASAQEISGVWAQVQGWSAGAARDEMRGVLLDEIRRRHGLLVPENTDPTVVEALLSGAGQSDTATTVTVAGQELRDQGHALYAAAFDGFAQAWEKDAELAAEEAKPNADQATVDALRVQADQLRQQAQESQDRARVLMEQSTWLEAEGPAAVNEVYRAGSADALTRLQEEFAKRWGRPPAPAAVTQLAPHAQQGFNAPRDRLTVVVIKNGSPLNIPMQLTTGPGQNPGSTDPSVYAIPAPAAPAVAVGPEAAARAADAQRRLAAAAALNGMGDQESATAARLAALAFPQGPEAALQSAPSTPRGSAPGPGLTQQRPNERGR